MDRKRHRFLIVFCLIGFSAATSGSFCAEGTSGQATSAVGPGTSAAAPDDRARVQILCRSSAK